MYFSIANVFHFIDTETEASERLGNEQSVGRRAGIPTQDHLSPKCWAIKCHHLLEIFPARECLDSINLSWVYRLKSFYKQLQNMMETFPKSTQFLLLTKKT